MPGVPEACVEETQWGVLGDDRGVRGTKSWRHFKDFGFTLIDLQPWSSSSFFPHLLCQLVSDFL